MAGSDARGYEYGIYRSFVGYTKVQTKSPDWRFGGNVPRDRLAIIVGPWRREPYSRMLSREFKYQISVEGSHSRVKPRDINRHSAVAMSWKFLDRGSCCAKLSDIIF